MAIGTVKIGNASELQFRLHAEARAIRPELEDALNDIAKKMQQTAQGMVGKRTGNLARAIETDDARRAGNKGTRAQVQVDLRKAPYGIWVNEGTGIFGSKHRSIKAKTGNMLVFEGAGIRGRKGPLIFARSVKGQEAQHFMERAFELIERTYVPARLAKLQEDIADF